MTQKMRSLKKLNNIADLADQEYDDYEEGPDLSGPSYFFYISR